jgi:hypothetical protein
MHTDTPVCHFSKKPRFWLALASIVGLGRSTFGTDIDALIQFLKRNVRPVRPSYRPPIKEEPLKKALYILQRLKSRPQIPSEVDRFL